jgi:hypothetical protein
MPLWMMRCEKSEIGAGALGVTTAVLIVGTIFNWINELRITSFRLDTWEEHISKKVREVTKQC